MVNPGAVAVTVTLWIRLPVAVKAIGIVGCVTDVAPSVVLPLVSLLASAIVTGLFCASTKTPGPTIVLPSASTAPAVSCADAATP